MRKNFGGSYWIIAGKQTFARDFIISVNFGLKKPRMSEAKRYQGVAALN
ncbi:cytidine deaminase [Vibrio mediterranei AK1]|nr:cytidine deaminase [Vibrio mediterranei AK1]